jgi:hypothetical protein
MHIRKTHEVTGSISGSLCCLGTSYVRRHLTGVLFLSVPLCLDLQWYLLCNTEAVGVPEMSLPGRGITCSFSPYRQGPYWQQKYRRK